MPIRKGITSCQIRMARAALRWSIQRLSDETGISERTIRRLEDSYGPLQNTTVEVVSRLVGIFERHGFIFLPEDGSPEGPGIRWGSYPGREVDVL
jgi:transcriptional regulator with XRE-family HTH domain